VDIAAWLRRLGLEQYAPAFRANEIDTSLLPSPTVGRSNWSCRRRANCGGGLRARGWSRDPSRRSIDEGWRRDPAGALSGARGSALRGLLSRPPLRGGSCAKPEPLPP